MREDNELYIMQRILAIAIMVITFICFFPLFVIAIPIVIVAVTIYEVIKYFKGE